MPENSIFSTVVMSELTPRRKFVLGGLTAGIGAVLPSRIWATHEPGHPPPPRKSVGVVAPLSGSFPNPDFIAGVKTATSGAAKVPDLTGHVIELVIHDSQGEPSKAVESIRKLASEGVIVIISGDFTNVLAAEANIAKELGVPIIAGISIGLLHSPNPHPWVFQLPPNESQISKGIFTQLRELASEIWSANQTWAIAFGSSVLQANLGSIYENALRSFGRNYAGWFILSEPDSAPKADAVLILGGSIEQILENDDRLSLYKFALVDSLYINGVELSQASMSDRMIFFSLFSEEDARTRSIGKTFTAAYQSDTGRSPGDSAALGYTSLQLAADVLRRTTVFDGDSMRIALSTLEIGGEDLILPWDSVRFNDLGENIGARPILLGIDGNIAVPI